MLFSCSLSIKRLIRHNTKTGLILHKIEDISETG